MTFVAKIGLDIVVAKSTNQFSDNGDDALHDDHVDNIEDVDDVDGHGDADEDDDDDDQGQREYSPLIKCSK